MTTKPLKDSLPDEHLLQVEPRPKPSVEAGWRSRPHLYAGRALSAEALASEQRERSGYLALRGQMVSPGVITGLEVRLEQDFLHISPGMGLSASGEDVVLHRLHRAPLRKIPAFRPGPLGPAGFDLGALYSGSDADLAATHRGLEAAVLVLVPVVSRADHTTDTPRPVTVDPELAAFEDLRLVDGCALVFYALPRTWPLPPRVQPADQLLWRNRLVWDVFTREQNRPPGTYAPWEEMGVPLALVGFGPPASGDSPPPTPPLFADRASVVRTGGAPRSRTPLLAARGSPLFWQARSLQFSEHLAAFSSEELASPTACAPFELLPPLGTLPKEAMDLFTWQHRFFPAHFALEAVPVPLEQLDAVAQTSASLAPLRTSRPERVRILVPLPEAYFEPHLLRRELLAPLFPQAISSAFGRLGQWLARRLDLRQKTRLLKDALGGVKPEHGFLEADPSAVPGEEPSRDITPPAEAAYETSGGRIPALEALFTGQAQGGSWTPAAMLGFKASQVSTATSRSRELFAVATYSPEAMLFTRSLQDEEKGRTWSAWEQVTTGPLVLDTVREIKTLWNGSEPVIAVLLCKPMSPVGTVSPDVPYSSGDSYPKTESTTRVTTTPLPVSGETVLEVRIAIGIRDSGGQWSWRDTASRVVSEVLAFTAVCWAPGHIDAFVSTRRRVQTQTVKEEVVTTRTVNTDNTITFSAKKDRYTNRSTVTEYELLTFPWEQTLSAQPLPEVLNTDKWIISMTALSSEDTPATGSSPSGQEPRIDLLFLSKTVGKVQASEPEKKEDLGTVNTTTPAPPRPTTPRPSTTASRSTATVAPEPEPRPLETPVTRIPTVRLVTPSFLAPAAPMDAPPPPPGPLGLLVAEPPAFMLCHLSGVHQGGAVALSQRKFIELDGVGGTLLSACWTLKTLESNRWRKQFDVLVLGPEGIRHAWYNEGWSPTLLPVSSTGHTDRSTTAVLLASSEQNGSIHAVWRTVLADAVDFARNTLVSRRFENNAWGPMKTVQSLAPLSEDSQRLGKPVGIVVNASSPLELFVASTGGLQHMRLLAGIPNELLRQQGLEGLIAQKRDLLGRVKDFIEAGSSRIQADTQNVRQLMISGTTEASRLVVSPILGATMVQGPLAARADIESYLSHFLRKSTTLGTTPTAPASGQLNSEADAREALEQATSTRRELTARLIEFVQELDLDVTGMAVLGVADIDVWSGAPPLVKFLFGDEVGVKNVLRDSIPLEVVVRNEGPREELLKRISAEPEALRNVFEPKQTALPDVTPLKTSDYFSLSVQHLENTLVLMQELERRMDVPTSLVEAYGAVRVKLEAAVAAAQERLRLVDLEVAEARQDVTVGRALLAEEEARIDALNARRDELFAQHVPFLVFQRPRECELTRDTSSRVLDPALGEDLLPQVFASTAAAPPELLAYAGLVRDSPLQWFTLGPSLLRGLDRLDLLQRTFEGAYTRSVQRGPVQLPLVAGRTSPLYAQGLSRLLSAREAALQGGRLGYFQYFQPAVLQTRTWLELQQTAHEQLSLGDLIDSAQGRPEVSQRAAAELQHITQVALGLYQRLGEVLPELRLIWAEQFSQYDGPVALHDLSRLPRWEQVELTRRRELQRLVDWLFQRVVPTQVEAASLMNDLVRVCLLLASHAPINELVSGHVHKPTVARVGGSVELAVDPSRVRVGMYVMIRSGNQMVQAVVEDLSAGVVRARVLTTSAATIALQAQQTVHFSDPGLGTGMLLPFVGTRR